MQFRPHESDTGTHPVNMMEHIVLQTGEGGGGGGGEREAAGGGEDKEVELM